MPTFVADVKGDLVGPRHGRLADGEDARDLRRARRRHRLCPTGRITTRPVQFWDLFGEQGHPIRTTVSEMGPLLLGRLMNLNEVQEGVLTIAFHVADKEGLLLLDLDDLQSMLVHCGEQADELTLEYGNVSKQSVGAIQRSLLQLRSQGGDHFFGEPALELDDFIGRDDSGRGIVNILAADRLMASPRLYSTFLLWLLSANCSSSFRRSAIRTKPKLCFFFDEAHLLFDDAPPGLLEKVEQVVRLIRSKGVGVYFITQNPIDIPDKVAGQLGNRVQHKLRAFTPRDQQAVKAAAETFRVNPDIDVATAITELKIGEALVSLLQPDGSPVAGAAHARSSRRRRGSGRSRRRSARCSSPPTRSAAKYDTSARPRVGRGDARGQGRRSGGCGGRGTRRRPKPKRLRPTQAKADAVAQREAAARSSASRSVSKQQQRLERQQQARARRGAPRSGGGAAEHGGQDDAVGGALDRQLGRTADRQPAAPRNLRRVAAWQISRELIRALEREWRDALCAKDMDRLRTLIHPRIHADRHPLERPVHAQSRRMARGDPEARAGLHRPRHPRRGGLRPGHGRHDRGADGASNISAARSRIACC